MALNMIPDFLRPRAAVGVTLGTSAVRAVRVERTDDGLAVRGALAVEFPLDRPPHPAEIEAALQKVASGLLDDRTRLVVNIRSREAGLHLWELPFDRPEKVARVLKYEAEPLFLTPVDELLLDFLPLKTGSGGRPGVIFGARPEDVSSVLADFRQGGLDPEIILPDSLGLLSAGRRLNSTDQACLLLDLGASRTNLALFQDALPVLLRPVLYGGLNITRQAAEKLNLDVFAAEELKRRTDIAADDGDKTVQVLREGLRPLLLEIERTLAAGLAEDMPVEIVLTGGGALAPGLTRFLSDQLGRKVSLLSEAEGLLPDLEALPPDAGAACGLAMLGMDSGYLPNLRQDELAPRRSLSRYRGQFSLLAAGLVLLLLINLAGFVYSYRLETRKYAEVKAAIEEIFRQTVPGVQKVVDPLTQMRQELDRLRQTGGAGPADGFVLDLLLEVSRVTAAQAGIRITDLALNPSTLEMQGEGGSFESIDRLKNDLAALPFFSEASPGGARVDPATRVLTFKISLKRRSG